jgi:acyl transferase domain-containing protein
MNSYVPSEGAVAFIVKTKSAAVRDNDNILAVIKASEVRHGGRSQGLAAPNVTAQIELHRSLIAKAGLSPSDVE